MTGIGTRSRTTGTSTTTTSNNNVTTSTSSSYEQEVPNEHTCLSPGAPGNTATSPQDEEGCTALLTASRTTKMRSPSAAVDVGFSWPAVSSCVTTTPRKKFLFSLFAAIATFLSILLAVSVYQQTRMIMAPLPLDEKSGGLSSLLDNEVQVPHLLSSSSSNRNDKHQQKVDASDKDHKKDRVRMDDWQSYHNQSLIQEKDPTFQKEKGKNKHEISKSNSSHKHEKSKKKKNKVHNQSDSQQNMASCLEDDKYSSHTAKTAYEMPFAALFKDTRGEKKFEASSIFNLDGTYYAVCDNSWAISKFEYDLTPFSDKNVMIGEPNREAEDSGYEAIFILNNTVYVVRESVMHHVNTTTTTTNNSSSNATISSSSSDTSASNITYHAIIEELEIHGNDYVIKDQCSCEFEFEGDSKGFEGAFGLEGIDGELYVIGLCEGNYCSESKKDDKGHGKIVLMKKKNKVENDDNEEQEDCLWKTLKVIDIPSTAFFTDYSDISIRPNGKVAITTQEDSAVWIGQLLGVQEGKLVDPDTLTFDENIHEVYYFPKSDTCKTIYCNIEGITFINDDMLMAVSDQMKKGGKQPFWCLEKDQSIHAFVLP